MVENRSRETLVKYDDPIEVSLADEPPAKGLPLALRKKTQLPPLENRPAEDILNTILPPREWIENGVHYVQYISHVPAERSDMTSLTVELDRKLTERQARENGICPVREDLYSQCFDELIRQVTIDCAERGVLLHRVRDEIKMTIAGYQTLYQSAVTFGIRKQIQALYGMEDLEKTKAELERKRIQLENKEIELRNRIDAIDKKNMEKRAIDNEKRAAEDEFLKYQEDHWSQMINTLQESPAK
eukprot:TRINITY_DN9325_c0_g2_i12.p1 TRINITY_DN9325_c0_g2~~TRINITY_DN9325_c0_g2_i12.p1  ORF type:complete len:243 (+),score=80.31 TRINITY_DN9325_c0_g2_i12:159-887(+)